MTTKEILECVSERKPFTAVFAKGKEELEVWGKVIEDFNDTMKKLWGEPYIVYINFKTPDSGRGWAYSAEGALEKVEGVILDFTQAEQMSLF